MAAFASTPPISLTLTRPRTFSLYYPRPHLLHPFPLTSKPLRFPLRRPSAYVSGPVFDPASAQPDPKKLDGWVEGDENVRNEDAISWGLLWGLLSEHKVGIALSGLALVGASVCTLSMPLFSGRFFEVLMGARPEPLWMLLGKVAVLYALEPVFTVIFVVNMNTIWEKVMSILRAQIFKRVLIQKVEFFDRYKVGELTGLLTSDLGSLKEVVSENVSRDRGFRALSEVIGTLGILFALSPQLAPILGLMMLTVSVLVG